MENSDSQLRELANVLAAVLQQQDPLTADQQRVALEYRLIRNGLGNYGGHGDPAGDSALIRMTQTVISGTVSILTFEDPVPPSATEAVLYVQTSANEVTKLCQPIDQNTRFIEIDDNTSKVEHINRVDLLDRSGAPIAAGVPTVVYQDPAPKGRSSATTATASKTAES